MQFLKNLYTWLITSSSDPLKTSLTVRGILTAAIPTVIWILPVFCTTLHVCINPDSLPMFADLFVKLVQYLLTFIQVVTAIAAVTMTIVGLIRKGINGQWSAAPAPTENL